MSILRRLSLRTRLTLWYGGLFFLAGITITTATYFIVQNSLNQGEFPGARFLQEAPPDRADAIVLRDGDGNRVTFEEALELVAQREQQRRDDALRTLLQLSGLALGLVGVGAVGFGWLMAGRVLRPINDITAAAKRVAASTHRGLHERIALEGPQDELKELADTFDDMLQRLDQSFASQRRFVDNASHELRTPLAINRTVLEVALDDPDASEDVRQLGRTLLATNARSERLIEGLLVLARSENELVERKPVELADIVDYVLGLLAIPAEQADVTVRSRIDSMKTVGDPVLLERLVQNVIQNAIKHNDAGGWVQVTTGPEGFVVSNSGPVVPAYEADALFEPFRRLQSVRTRSDRGVGLGLSIVRSITRAHGGEVTAEPRLEGGLVVRVRLPSSDTAGV